MNYQMFQKLKLIRNVKFSHLTIILMFSIMCGTKTLMGLTYGLDLL